MILILCLDNKSNLTDCVTIHFRMHVEMKRSEAAGHIQ